MARLSHTREQIMERAAQLLTTRGFNGFSYRDISTHLGVKNAAVHYHFPSKADLALALVDEYHQTLRKKTSEFMAYGGSALQQMEGFFAFTSRQCQLGRCICPFGAFSVDYSELPDDVKKATSEFLGDSIKWLTRVLELGRDQDEFSFAGDPKAKALEIMAALQGARQMVRVHEMDILDLVMSQIRKDLNI